MAASTQIASLQKQRPPDDYNWGYALCVGLNSVSTLHPMSDDLGLLKYAVKSSETAIKMLRMVKTGTFYRDYDQVIHLTNSDATYQNVVESILALANYTKAGDTVTITFSAHGFVKFVGTKSKNADGKFIKRGSDQNHVILDDDVLIENELYFLLKFFKPGIKIYLLFDMCESGTWLSKFSTDYNDNFFAFDLMEQKIRTWNSTLADFMASHNTKIMFEPLPNSVWTFGGCADWDSLNDKHNSLELIYGTVVRYGFDVGIHLKQNMIKYLEHKFLTFNNGNYWKGLYFIKSNRSEQYRFINSDGSYAVDDDGDYYFDSSKVPIYNSNDKIHYQIMMNLIPKLLIIGSEEAQYDHTTLFGVLK